MAGINERLRDAESTYLGDTAIPQDTLVTSARLKTGEYGQLGSSIVLVRAVEDITIADTKTVTVTVFDNDNATGGTDTTVAIVPFTASGITTFSAGSTIAEVILPRIVKEYTAVRVATTDAAATGTFDAFLSSPMGRSDV